VPFGTAKCFLFNLLNVSRLEIHIACATQFIALQVFTSLAIGAKGVMYFCYWTPPGSDFLRGQAIMTPAPGSKPDNANQVPGPK